MTKSVPDSRDVCLDDDEDHVWLLRVDRDDAVHCARCMRCLSIEVMLHAYVKLHGGEVRRG